MRALILLLVIGCAKEEAKPPAAPDAAAAIAAPVPPPPPAPDASVPQPRLVGGGKMEHCPTSVAGAKVDIAQGKGTVEITVTAADAKVTEEIRADAKHLVGVAKKDPKAVRHTGTGEGGGELGACAVVLTDTTITVAEVEGGAKISVKPKNAAGLEGLEKQVRDRQAMAATVQQAPSIVGTVGGGRMSHCPTTVPTAKVEIADGKDAVEVTITSSEPAATKEIRADAKHLADVSKKDPAEVKHTGSGEGGGGLGKCPIVLKDTVITATNVDGGSKITVKPKDPARLEQLKQDVKNRQAHGSH